MIRRALILGGSGMLARALSETLAARSIPATAVDLPHCDITDMGSIRRCVAPLAPSVIFNCAAYTRVDACETDEGLAMAVNGAGVGNVATVCREHHIKLVHISTDFVFDGAKGAPYLPTDTPAPLSVYGRSKLRGEELLQQANPQEWLIVRTAWLYGPGGASFPRTIIERARAGQPLRVVSDQVGSPTYTADLADALVDLASGNARGIFHATNAGQTSWYDFAQAILEAFGLQTELAPTTTADYLKSRPKQAIRPRYSVLDCTSLEAAIGHRMRPWNAALRAFAQQATAAS